MPRFDSRLYGVGTLIKPSGTIVDNTVARWNGTSGSSLQGSGVTLDDSDNLTIPGNLTVTGSTTAVVNQTFSGTVGISVQSLTALTVARTGTNYAFQVDTNTGSSVTGLKVTSNISGSDLALSVISSATDEDLTIDAKGAGTITLNGTGGGAIRLNRATSINGSLTLTGAFNVTASSTDAFTVGRTSTTNPVLQIDTNTSSAVTGLKVTGAAAASGLAIAVISSGTNENLTIDAKGSGTITLGATSTGGITLARAATINVSLLPDADDGAVLGASGTGFSDLFLASGAVINFAAGDVTVTHSTNALAFAGGSSGYTFDSPIGGSAGTSALPSFAFTLDSNTGFYNLAANQIGISLGNSSIFGLQSINIGTFIIANTRAAANSLFYFASQDEDGTDTVEMAVFGFGGRTQIINYTAVTLFHEPAGTPQYYLRSAAGGTQTVRALTITALLQTTADTAGANISVISGAGLGTGVGGIMAVTGGVGGATGAGGAITLTSGAGGSTSGLSGALTIASGTTTAGSTSASGTITIQSGLGSNSTLGTAGGASGAVTLQSQAGGTTATGTGGLGGTLSITGGAGGAATGAGTGGAGAGISITAGAGGNGGTASGAAGGITITSGAAGTGGNVAGGTLRLATGAAVGTGLKALIAHDGGGGVPTTAVLTTSLDWGIRYVSASTVVLYVNDGGVIKSVSLGTPA